MREWQIGDPVDSTTDGWMDAQNWGHGQDEEEKPSPDNGSKPKTDEYSQKAWKLYNEYREEEALKYINMSLARDKNNANNLNRKAIILEALKRYAESEECYSRSIDLEYVDLVCDNRARMLYDWAFQTIEDAKKSRNALDMLEDAMNICIRAVESLPGEKSEEDVVKYLKLYESINFYMNYERTYARNIETLKKYSKDELFTITGRNFQEHVALYPGMPLKLVREVDNKFDSDAIAVYAGERKVGYVANSDHTRFEMTSKASELKDGFTENAEYVCYLERYAQIQFTIGRIIR